MSSFSERELKAIISLLDDNDPEVFDQVQQKLILLGKEVIPVLEDAWSKSFDLDLQQRIENIIHKIQFESLRSRLLDWKRNHADDLLAGLIHVARFQYPDLDEDKVHDMLEKVKESAVVETQMHQAPLEKVYALNRLFYEVFGFRGNTTNFHSPQNSCINMVLETRRGNPLLLSSIYSIAARHAGMPVYGINLPEHFVLAYQEKSTVQFYEYTYPEAKILFYINPFSMGSVFSKSDVDQFLKKLNLQPQKMFYEPCTNTAIIQRALRNLASSFQKLGDVHKLNELDLLLDTLNAE